MRVGIASPPKQPAETWFVEIDFANELDVAGGETITQRTVTAKNLTTGADSTGTFLSGGAQGTGTICRVRILGGTPGETHRVQMRITTSSENVYEHELDVPVEEV